MQMSQKSTSKKMHTDNFLVTLTNFCNLTLYTEVFKNELMNYLSYENNTFFL